MKQGSNTTIKHNTISKNNRIDIITNARETIYRNATDTYAFDFADSVNKSWLFKMEDAIHKVSFKLINDILFEEESDNQVLFNSFKDNHNNARVELKETRYSPTNTIRNKILYSSFIKDSDLQYTVQADCLKEEIIINQKHDNYEYAYIIKLENLEPKLCEDGTILFISTDYVQAGEVIFKISPAVLCDSNGAISDKAKYLLYKQLADTYLLRFSANAEWVNSELRVYPVALLLNHRVTRN